ncbi:peptidoglycan-binding protein [Methyloligella solikamskensis]|uniref:Peptidoglycan-binding protein n=1 Tax=Methyloligella solikamskensis TaxID=1177756 RepID=A0ABW3J7N1_9HYPH
MSTKQRAFVCVVRGILAGVAVAAIVAMPPVAQADEAEIEFWQSVKETTVPEELEAYLERYPEGDFAPLARIRLDKLKKKAVQPGQETPSTHTVASASGNASTPPVHDCDWLAAHPDYAVEGVLGVSSHEIVTATAIESCRAALEEHPGTARFEFQLARALHYGDSFDEARSLFLSLAEQGHAGAALNLGIIFGNGQGVAKDYRQSAKWFRQAAEADDAAAMASLGWYYRKGFGVEQDDDQALAWMRKAVRKNAPWGFYNLAGMYADGRGVAKDMKEAARLRRIAAEMGVGQSMFALGRQYENGEGVAQDKAEAVKWYKKAAENGSVSGMVSLGYAYHAGEGVAQDFSKAAEWYREAVREGDATAKNNLAIMYDNGQGVPRDGKKAARILLEAYLGGDRAAKKNLEEQSEVLSRETRREIQRRLREAGVYDGSIDGQLGPATRRALRAYASKKPTETAHDDPGKPAAKADDTSPKSQAIESLPNIGAF